MPDTPWKAAERCVADELGSHRQVRHQGGDGDDQGDVALAELFIEVKYRKTHGCFTWWRKAKKTAEKKSRASKNPQAKQALLMLREKGSPCTLVVTDLKGVMKLAEHLARIYPRP